MKMKRYEINVRESALKSREKQNEFTGLKVPTRPSTKVIPIRVKSSKSSQTKNRECLKLMLFSKIANIIN